MQLTVRASDGKEPHVVSSKTFLAATWHPAQRWPSVPLPIQRLWLKPLHDCLPRRGSLLLLTTQHSSRLVCRVRARARRAAGTK